MFKQVKFLIVLMLPLLLLGNVLAQDDIESVSITITDEELTVPETVNAGWVDITFDNTSEIPSFLIFSRLDDDATMDDFMEALMELMGGATDVIPPATFLGSPSPAPATAYSVTYNLEAGMYILLNVAGEEPQIATFMVEGDDVESDFEPESDLAIALVDFAFGLPAELPAGEQTWLIDNIGEQWHEMIFIPVPDGTSLEEAMSFMMEMEGEGEEEMEGEEGEEAGMPEFGFAWAPMSSGQQAWVDIDLPAGTYLVTCFIEDVNSEDMTIHAELGMIQIVTVVEAED